MCNDSWQGKLSKMLLLDPYKYHAIKQPRASFSNCCYLHLFFLCTKKHPDGSIFSLDRSIIFIKV